MMPISDRVVLPKKACELTIKPRAHIHASLDWRRNPQHHDNLPTQYLYMRVEAKSLKAKPVSKGWRSNRFSDI